MSKATKNIFLNADAFAIKKSWMTRKTKNSKMKNLLKKLESWLKSRKLPLKKENVTMKSKIG